MVNNIQSPL